MTELCDPRGSCSQDAQTFKGIFFQHFTAFCTPLPVDGDRDEEGQEEWQPYTATPENADAHAAKCRSYTRWVEHNARAALRARDEKGVFGMWWGVRGRAWAGEDDVDENEDPIMSSVVALSPSLPEGAVDVRNTPHNSHSGREQPNQYNPWSEHGHREGRRTWPRDPNERGRGRTVETQGGGVMVLRAVYEFRIRFMTAGDD